MIDTHMLDKGGQAGDLLRRAESEEWVCFHVADTLLTELSDVRDDSRREELLDLASTHSISMGPMVLDHSLLGLSVLGSDEDALRIAHVHQILWSRDWPSDGHEVEKGNRTAKTRSRDTLHVANAIRYAYDAFVTHDRRVYEAQERVRAAYPGLQIMSPSQALRWLGNEIELHRRRWERMNLTPRLPEWPTSAEVAAWADVGDDEA